MGRFKDLSIPSDGPDSHDPLCDPYDKCGDYKNCPCSYNDDGQCLCQCDLIAKVRESQNQADTQMRTVFYEQGHCDGQRDMLAKCIATVEGMECESAAPESEWVNKWKASRALRALKESHEVTDR